MKYPCSYPHPIFTWPCPNWTVTGLPAIQQMLGFMPPHTQSKLQTPMSHHQPWRHQPQTVQFSPILLAVPTKANSTYHATARPSTIISSSYPLLQHHLHKQGITTTSATTVDTIIEGELLPCSLHNMTQPHWKATLPSLTALWMGLFGKQDQNYSFTKQASFDTITYHIFLSKIITKHNMRKLVKAHPPLQKRHCAITDLADYNFHWYRHQIQTGPHNQKLI